MTRVEKANEARRKLTRSALAEVVQEIQEILWPADDPEEEWNPDNIEAVARALTRIGCNPLVYEDDERNDDDE